MTSTTEHTEDEERGIAMLAELRAALRDPWVRLEFDMAISLSKGALHSVRVFLPGPTPRSKWRQVGLRILAPDNMNTRRGLIEHLAELYGDCSVDGDHDYPDEWNYSGSQSGSKTCRSCGNRIFD